MVGLKKVVDQLEEKQAFLEEFIEKNKTESQ